MIKVAVGYDPRESVAFHVCVSSIIRTTSMPVSIIPLSLTAIGGYRETHNDGSNQFIYSRFLVPYINGYRGWVLFIDGDMLLRADLKELWDLRDDAKAVLCVKHNYKTKMKKKYLGSINEDYPRKNWSSVVLWNCGHPANKVLTPEKIQQSSGAYLHRFTWLSDDLIGELPIEWNWLPDEFGSNQYSKLLHWTLGTPCFNEFRNAEMSDEWHGELRVVNHSDQL